MNKLHIATIIASMCLLTMPALSFAAVSSKTTDTKSSKATTDCMNKKPLPKTSAEKTVRKKQCDKQLSRYGIITSTPIYKGGAIDVKDFVTVCFGIKVKDKRFTEKRVKDVSVDIWNACQRLYKTDTMWQKKTIWKESDWEAVQKYYGVKVTPW